MIRLALRNVLRQKARTGMTLAAIVLGVAALILAGGFVEDMFLQLGETIIHSQTGHIQVFKTDFLEKGTRYPDQYLIDKPEEIASKISEIPGVNAVMGRLYFSGLANNGKRDLAIVGDGIEPHKEAELGTFISIIAGRQLEDADEDGILVGQGVAQSLALKPGDRLTLLLNTAEGAMNTMDLTVIGIFQSFSKDFDARAVRIPLSAAKELLLTSGVNQIVIALNETSHTDTALKKVAETLKNGPYDIKSWRTLSDFYDKSVELYKSQFGALQLIILLMVLLSVVNSVNMSVFERQSEFGTMRAIGNRSSAIFRLILLESVLTGAIGALLGMCIGCGLALGISAVGIPMPPPPNANLGYTAHIKLLPLSVAIAGATGFIATVLAAILPARKAARLHIVDALRQGV